MGLPLGIAFADRGKAYVSLVDTNEMLVDKVQKGILPFMEDGGEVALKRVVGKNLVATKDPGPISKADVVIVVTGTPVDNYLNPSISAVTNVIEHYRSHMHPGQLLVLRSTLMPGLTSVIYNQLAAQQIQVSFCPERVAQGYAIRELYQFPQIVSAFDKETENRASRLFGLVAPEILRMAPMEAEMVKLFANSWRYLEFAIANQHYMIAESAGLNFYRIYEALTHDYPRAQHFSQPGFTAGPCLFKDTMQLSAFCNNQFFLGHAAMLVNEGLPNFVVSLLERKVGPLRGKKIGLLGMSFKANHDDTRESLSYKTRKILIFKGAAVLDTDVYQPTASKLDEILNTADAFILGVPHQQYLKLNLNGKPFVDCWGVWGEKQDLCLSPHNETPFKIAA